MLSGFTATLTFALLQSYQSNFVKMFSLQNFESRKQNFPERGLKKECLSSVRHIGNDKAVYDRYLYVLYPLVETRKGYKFHVTNNKM